MIGYCVVDPHFPSFLSLHLGFPERIFIFHLPDCPSARLSVRLCLSLSFLRTYLPGSTTVTEEGPTQSLSRCLPPSAGSAGAHTWWAGSDGRGRKDGGRSYFAVVTRAFILNGRFHSTFGLNGEISG